VRNRQGFIRHAQVCCWDNIQQLMTSSPAQALTNAPGTSLAALPSAASDAATKSIPWAATTLNTTGALVTGLTGAQASEQNARTYRTEGTIATTQGAQQEAQERRSTAMTLGSMRAAGAQAGAGTDGSAGRAISQSAMNAELDALNIRYKSQLQRWSYFAQADNLDREATAQRTSGALKAGAALLKGYSSNYLAGPDMSGLYS
jgi:hypothetical protein